jgi:dipeptidyl aminopeptidase/acylaminoacyl peptidase
MAAKPVFLDLEGLLRTPAVDTEHGFDISPDGRRLAFSWNRTGRWEIYELDLDAPGAPRKLTSGPGAKFSPCYSPNGSRLAYTLDQDGSEDFDIWLCDLASGEHTNLTPGTAYAIQPSLSWSPDSERIAIMSQQSGRFDTYWVSAVPTNRSSQPALVFNQSGHHLDAHWSPDGRRLAVVSESKGQDFAIHIVPAPSRKGEASPLYSAAILASPLQDVDGAPFSAYHPAWSPGGDRLAFSSDSSGVHEIGLYEVASGQISWLTSGKGEKTSPDWSPDGERVAYVLADGADTWLAVHELGQATPILYQVEPGVHYQPHFAPDSHRLFFIFDNPRHPDDLWMLDLDNGAFTQLTHSLPHKLDPADFVMPAHIEYPGMDGQPVPSLLYLPRVAQAQLPPAVIVIHGGPSWLFQFLWYPLMAHLASRGWVVLAPNYRGSTGYGRAWQLANRFDLGGVDTRDVVAGADYLIREGLADPRRIAVTGRSHGGYLTLCCLTQYPDRWVGGSAIVPFINWFTSHKRCRADLQHWNIENMGDPVENHDLWYERSPYFFLDRILCPVQLICGANDPRCPASDSIEARDRLLALGKQVDFILYEDEGHSFLKIENVIDHELRRVAFLARVLENEASL